MAGERDLEGLLRHIEPEERPGSYVFGTVDGPSGVRGVEVLASVVEQEGLSVLISREDADRVGLPHDYVAGWITLRVHSALDMVGLTAAVSRSLADEGISCNVVAGHHHDHLLVPLPRVPDALAVLRALPFIPVGVRRAGLADAAAIAEFQTECWREAYRGLVPQDYLDRVGVADRLQRWRDRLAGRREVALAELDGTVVGVVSWSPGQEPDAPARELKSLYVAAAHRGTGLAARLLERAVGSGPAYLWVFEGNPRAQAFYGRNGFCYDRRRTVDPDTGLSERLYIRR